MVKNGEAASTTLNDTISSKSVLRYLHNKMIMSRMNQKLETATVGEVKETERE